MFTLYIIEGEKKNNGHKFIKKHEGFPAIHVHSPIAEPRFLADLSLEKTVMCVNPMINHPQVITIFMGGISTIPSHGSCLWQPG